MDQGGVQPILRCGQCGKPFDKQSTLKRHGYYCRSRRISTATRSRSCIPCARGKARCDNGQPGCSRCKAKAIECHYPANTPKSPGSRIQHHKDAQTESDTTNLSLATDYPRVENLQEASNAGDITFNNALPMSDAEFENLNLGQGYLDLDLTYVDFPDFLNSQTNLEAVQSAFVGPLSPVHHPIHSLEQMVQVQRIIPSSRLSIPTVPTSNVRSFVQKPKIKNGAERTTKLIIHTLKSYPLMMMRHNILPPFIHPGSISSNVENNFMESLANCVSLVHMISSGIQGSRKLFWKNVRLECERLCEEHLKLDRWELLAAIQAVLIYVLVRLDEGETDYNNLDALLLSAVNMMSKQFHYLDIAYSAQSVPRNSGIDLDWKEWIFEESRRRLAVVYRVLDMLFYTELGAMCSLQKDLILAPLPAKKQLWEACDEFTWKTAGEQEIGAKTTFGLAANGDLVKLKQDQAYCNEPILLYSSLGNSNSPRSWEEWFLGMDGLGGLVMLAAALID